MESIAVLLFSISRSSVSSLIEIVDEFDYGGPLLLGYMINQLIS